MSTTNKLSLFPHHAALDDEGHLAFGPHRAVDLADRFGTPLYVYDTGTIRDRIAAYRRGLAAYPGPTRLTYASKAFLCPALVRLMTTAGVGLDVASAGELFIARHGGADPTQIHLHGNSKSRLDLREALAAGIGHIVVDNRDELACLTRLAAEMNRSASVWLRITPDVAVETHHRYTVTGTAGSKFGFSLDEARQVAAALLTNQNPDAPFDRLRRQLRYTDTTQEADSASWLTLTGLHLHLGSHFHEAGPLAEAVGKVLDLAKWLYENCGWKMKNLCPGGGWGVPYQPTDSPMPVEPFVTDLAQAVADACRQRQLPLPDLVLEPGRSLVAQAGVALYRVNGRKQLATGRTFVNIDGGLADNPRPALYQATYTALLANRAAEPETDSVAIAGPFCESSDILIESVELPVAEPGDVLAVPVAGAYQLSMGSNYNAALRPAVVFIEGQRVRLVQRRETFEDLVGRDVD